MWFELLLLTVIYHHIALVLRKYSAYALPKHTAFGIHGVGQDGEPTLDDSDDRLQMIELDVVKKLLCNDAFTDARAGLLEVAPTRQQQLDETLCSEDDKTLVRAIRAFRRSKEKNYLPATVIHIKDIERLLSFGEKGTDNEVMSGCVEAVAMWRRKLLHNCGAGKASSTVQSTELSDHSKPESCSVYRVRGNCITVAKNLLAKDDAWSLNDTSEESVQTRKSSRGRKSRNKSIDSAAITTAINTDVCQLKTELSIGRSILSLAKFAQSCSSKDANHVSAILQEEVSLCLRDAINVLASISRALQVIMSVGDLEEEDLDDSITPPGGPTLCVQRFALARAEAKPLFTMSGIFLAECWLTLGKLSSSQSTTKHHKDKLLMVACFDRALLILSSSKEIPSKQLLEPLTKHKALLQSNINRKSIVFVFISRHCIAYTCVQFHRFNGSMSLRSWNL